ncbi:Protein of unknown function, partial [Gryllus bimaculatus]
MGLGRDGGGPTARGGALALRAAAPRRMRRTNRATPHTTAAALRCDGSLELSLRWLGEDIGDGIRGGAGEKSKQAKRPKLSLRWSRTLSVHVGSPILTSAQSQTSVGCTKNLRHTLTKAATLFPWVNCGFTGGDLIGLSATIHRRFSIDKIAPAIRQNQTVGAPERGLCGPQRFVLHRFQKSGAGELPQSNHLQSEDS